jgi:hypothetical protein
VCRSLRAPFLAARAVRSKQCRNGTRSERHRGVARANPECAPERSVPPHAIDDDVDDDNNNEDVDDDDDVDDRARAFCDDDGAGYGDGDDD